MSLVVRVTAFLFVAGALLALPSGPAGAQQQVTVSLNDFPSFQVTANPSSVAAGAVDFQVSNDSPGISHNLRVIRTDLAPGALPVSGGQVNESQVNVVASSQDLAQGATDTVSANLAGGNYVLICNILGHYGAGMRTAFTVTAAQPTDIPTDGGPTDGGATGATATPTAGGTQLPQTGAGAEAGSSGGWWVLAMLAGAGVALVGLGAVTYRRVRVER